MSKPLKYLSFAIGGTLLVVLAAVGVFLATFDPNAYKARIVTAVHDATGRTLEIPGALEVELFPWLALRTGEVRLGNAPGFGAAPFAELTALSASVRLLPLLGGSIEVGAVRIEGLEVALVRRADGTSNWSDLAGRGSGGEAGSGGGATPLSIGAIEVRGAHLTLDDAQASRKLDVSELELATGELRAGAGTPFQGGARIAVSEPEVTATLTLSGTLAGDAPVPTLTDLKLTLDAQGASLPEPVSGATLAIARLALGDTVVAEQVDAAAAGATLAAARVEHGASTTVSGLTLGYLGVMLSGELALADDTLTAKLASEPFAPRAVLEAAEVAVPTTKDPKALTSAKLAFELVKRGDALALERFTATLDQTKLEGRIAFDSLERKALRFDLALDALDLDRYLPPPAPAAAPEQDGGLAAVAVPAEAIRGLDVAGTLRAGKLTMAGLAVSALRVSVQAKDDRLEVAPFSLQLYGGKASGKASLDARGATPAAKVAAELSDVAVGDLMAAALDEVYAKGDASLTLDLAGKGATLGTIQGDLDGALRFEVRDGTLEGFNVWKQVRLAWAKYQKRQTPAASEPDRTEFSTLRGAATIADGVATLQDVKAAIRFAEVTAVGTADLGAAALDVTATARINEAPVFGPDEDLSDLKGVALPIDIDGPFASPRFGIDFGKVAASLLKAAPKQKAEEALKKKLKGIFR
jgi:AsmA protein